MTGLCYGKKGPYASWPEIENEMDSDKLSGFYRGTTGDVHYKRMDRESQLKQILGKLEYLFENEITYHYDEKYGKVPLACEPFSRARDYVLLHPPDVPLPVSVKREGDELIWNYEIYAIEQEALARFTNQGK